MANSAFRTIEDELRACIAELEAENAKLKAEIEQRADHESYLSQEFANTYYEKNARIAELEAFVDQLIEAGEMIAECSEYESGRIEWEALVDNRKEREE